jgi:hypothetical protein
LSDRALSTWACRWRAGRPINDPTLLYTPHHREQTVNVNSKTNVSTNLSPSDGVRHWIELKLLLDGHCLRVVLDSFFTPLQQFRRFTLTYNLVHLRAQLTQHGMSGGQVLKWIFIIKFLSQSRTHRLSSIKKSTTTTTVLDKTDFRY